MIQLRPYQANALAEIQNAYRIGKRAPLLCAPTGSGKSAMVRHMLDQTRKRTLILVHREELLDRISNDLEGVPHGHIKAGSKLSGHAIQVGMVQTVARRLESLPAFEWVISDECHYAMSPTWLAVLKHYGSAHHLGMSATPCRLDGRGLGEHFDQIVYGPSVRELTDLGYLVPARVFAPAVDVAGLRKARGDYVMADAASMMDQRRITGDAVREYTTKTPGERAIVFCCTREHADHVAEQFRDAGISCMNVDGAMDRAERRHRIESFRRGGIDVLTNVDLLTTGFDCPEVSAGIFLRPTASLSLWLQMAGRFLRPSPDKNGATLLDLVGNVLRHGLPDADRQWTLDGRVQRKTPPPVKQCTECYAAFKPAPACPACGFKFPVEKRAAIKKAADGELAEVSASDVEARANWLRTAPYKDVMKQARTREALAEVAKARGYDHRWVARQLAFRGAAKDRHIQQWRDRQSARA